MAYHSRKRRRTSFGGSFASSRGSSAGRRFGRIRGASRGYQRNTGYYGRYGIPATQYGGTELKFFEGDVDIPFVSGLGTVVPTLNDINQGTGERERIGRKVTIKQIHLRFGATLLQALDQTGPNPSALCRCMVILDTQCNGTLIGAGSVLQTLDYLSFNRLDNKDRYKILWDKRFALNTLSMVQTSADPSPGTRIAISEVRRYIEFNKRCNIPIEFSGTTGILSEIRSNNIVVLWIASSGSIAIDGKVRMRFEG